MQNNDSNKSVSPEALERRHESRNPAIGWILFVVALVALMVAGSLWVVGLAMSRLEQSRPPDPLANQRGLITAPDLEPLQRFPGPNLQVNPHDELVALRAREEEELNTYGWVDRSNGVVRIPIDRAMDLLVQRGFPARSSNAPPATGKSSYELIRERSQQR